MSGLIARWGELQLDGQPDAALGVAKLLRLPGNINAATCCMPYGRKFASTSMISFIVAKKPFVDSYNIQNCDLSRARQGLQGSWARWSWTCRHRRRLLLHKVNQQGVELGGALVHGDVANTLQEKRGIERGPATASGRV